MKIIVCIAKNEPHIQEWIDYHLQLGFDRIYIYANDWSYVSGNPSVFVMAWPGKKEQMNAYNHALRNIRFDWAAFIDCDEYIVCPEGLDNFLKHQDYSIAMPWVIMGNRESEGSTVTERFQHWDYDPNGHVKTFVRNPTNGMFTNPHYINDYMVTPRGHKHRGPFTPEKPGRLFIRHYYYQDKDYWETKIQRGRADTGTTRDERWERGEDFNTYKV
jgi:hypothetical protein